MALTTFTIQAKCVADDAELYRNIESALTRQLQVVPQYREHTNVAVMVGSGPSVAGQLDNIREEMGKPGRYLVAIKDAHDWLIDHGIMPDYAIAVDPQASRANCFMPDQTVQYLIASQCHPDLFDRLQGFDVRLWHMFVRQGQTIPPPGTPLISGGTTSGLRAITLFYTMGFRQFELFGYDSCLQDGKLRMNGDVPRPGDDTVNDIIANGRTFYCNPSMTAQASEFQNLFLSMPDIEIHGHGDGLIQEILKARSQQPTRTISFIHGGGPSSASYRYRCWIPGGELGASINNFTADVLIFSKPEPSIVRRMKEALGQGKVVIADFCDHHFDRPEYRDVLRLADAVTCGTEEMAKIIRPLGREPIVVPEPYEGPELSPHCWGNRLLWFGHASNFLSLFPLLPILADFPLRIMTNRGGVHNYDGTLLEWSPDDQREELALADMVVMPATALYKSPNRTIEAIRAGCFVVAEPHPSILKIPGIWIGDIREGVLWASSHPYEANARTAQAQQAIRETYAPRTVAYAWSRVIQGCPSTWAAERTTGQDGSISTENIPPQTRVAISGDCPMPVGL